jgi:hypothetical protein
MRSMLHTSKKIILVFFCSTFFGGGLFAGEESPVSFKVLSPDKTWSVSGRAGQNKLFCGTWQELSTSTGCNILRVISTQYPPCGGCFLDNIHILIWGARGELRRPEIYNIEDGKRKECIENTSYLIVKKAPFLRASQVFFSQSKKLLAMKHNDALIVYHVNFESSDATIKLDSINPIVRFPFGEKLSKQVTIECFSGTQLTIKDNRITYIFEISVDPKKASLVKSFNEDEYELEELGLHLNENFILALLQGFVGSSGSDSKVSEDTAKCIAKTLHDADRGALPFGPGEYL